MDGRLNPARLRAEERRLEKQLALYGESFETRELLSRVRLLQGDAAGGWAQLRRAFAADPLAHCAYAEGDEADPLSREAERKILFEPGEGRLPTTLLLEAFPAKTAALAWRGALKRRALDYAGAAADLTQALARGERTADVLTWLGEAELQLGRTAAGLKHLRAALKRPDAQAWHHAWLGRPRLTLLRDPQGLADLDRAIALAPRCHLFYGWRGIARLRLGRGKDALADFDAGLKLGAGKDARWISGWRAVALQRVGPAQKALPALEAAAADDPGYAPVASALAEALRADGQFNRWAERLELAARLNRGSVQRLTALSRPDLEALARDLSRATNAAGRRWLGKVLLLLGNPAEALKALSASRARDTASPLTRLWRGEALTALGKPEEALSEFDAAAASAWAAEARAGRAKALAALGRIPQAVKDLEEAARLDPGSAGILADLGALRLLCGDAAPAAEVLARATNRDPRFVDALVDLSLAQARLGQAAAARKTRARALAAGPAQARARLELWETHAKGPQN